MTKELIGYLDELDALLLQGHLFESGPRGFRGPEGKSAYEVWLDQGNEGTIDDFLNSLALSGVSYDLLIDKPKIESVELTGDKTFDDLGLSPIGNQEIANIL